MFLIEYYFINALLKLLQSEKDALEESRRALVDAAREAKATMKDSERRIVAEKGHSQHSLDVLKSKHEATMARMLQDHESELRLAIKKQEEENEKAIHKLEEDHSKAVARVTMKVDQAKQKASQKDIVVKKLRQEITDLKEELSHSFVSDKAIRREVLKGVAAANETRQGKSTKHRLENNKLRKDIEALEEKLVANKRSSAKLKRQKRVSDDWSAKRLERANTYRDEVEDLRESLNELSDER